MQPAIEFDATFLSDAGEATRRVKVTKVVVGGWTGRDKHALQHHIDELAKIGVAAPEKTPMFYRVGVSRLSTADAIEVIGDGSSGEVEYVLLKHAGDIWVGAGSDHTDRAVEKSGITVAKQLCDKPIARRFWRLAEIEDHWDQLQINSYIIENGVEVPYQAGSVTANLSPRELLRHFAAEGSELDEGTLMFGGTCGVIGDVRFSRGFRIELADPVKHRAIGHSYAVIPVPING